MIKLRVWQRECIGQALQTFEQQTHFLCQATPGAGKTAMVASLAKLLLANNRIDFVLCFSPSRAVAKNVAATFRQIIGRSFNGRIGAAGGSYTYQSMKTFPAELWQILSEHRVLVVLDEVHHCSGADWDNFATGNSWGRTIIDRVQGKARFTIALSGTPWRTDDNPIVLSRYTQPDGQLHCDYEYGLKRAVIDGVCRAPKIVLTDNRKISLKSSVVGLKTYSSIRETIEHGHITYPDFLFRDEIIDHTLSEASKKLSEIRKYRPSAAGLVVAATVAHAEQIATRLLALGERAIMVTHKTPESQKIISDFKTSDDLWIISVGMISEGTDIPRLQVCCHLSRIRTELHFRQVLGRILRRQKEEHSDLGGWLYVLAEPSLTEFAQRIGDDLPEHQVVSFTPKTSGHSHSEKKPEMLLKEKPDTPWDLDIELPGAYNVAAADNHERRSMELSVSEHYWSEVLSLFDERVALHS